MSILNLIQHVFRIGQNKTENTPQNFQFKKEKKVMFYLGSRRHRVKDPIPFCLVTFDKK